MTTSSNGTQSQQDRAVSLLVERGVRFGESQEFEIATVRRMDEQPRTEFDSELLNSLEHGIRLMGQLQDGFVRPLSDQELAAGRDGSKVRWELVDGERRFIVATRLGRPFKAKPVYNLTPDLQYSLSVALNFNRADHTVTETVMVCKRLKQHHTVPEIAKIIGRSEPGVYQFLSLLELHPDIFPFLGPPHPPEKRLRMTAGLSLIRLNHEAQLEVWKELRNEPTQRVAAQLVNRKLHQDASALAEGRRPRKMDARDAKRVLNTLGSKAAAVLDRCSQQVIDSISVDERRALYRSVKHIEGDLELLRQALDPKGEFEAETAAP